MAQTIDLGVPPDVFGRGLGPVHEAAGCVFADRLDDRSFFVAQDEADRAAGVVRVRRREADDWDEIAEGALWRWLIGPPRPPWTPASARPG